MDFVVLSEEMLFIITQTGAVRSQKRFDYPPANFFINNFEESKN